MPDLCFYAPWIMKEPIPDPFRMMLEKAGKKRISYDEADCSMRNIRKQGKVSRLHGPTLHALLTLIQIRKEKDSGAAGIQRGRDTINYFCIPCPRTCPGKDDAFTGDLYVQWGTKGSVLEKDETDSWRERPVFNQYQLYL